MISVLYAKDNFKKIVNVELLYVTIYIMLNVYKNCQNIVINVQFAKVIILIYVNHNMNNINKINKLK